jgi:orotate phosphoribosyltransferase
MFLFYPEYRNLIIDGFLNIIKIKDIKVEVIAGTSTAGIPHGMSLANKLNLPFIYIREKPKLHGLKNQIEGIDDDSNLADKKIVVIEDLISTGGSSARAVQAVRNANGVVDYCLSIFSYGLLSAINEFNNLSKPCQVIPILTYDILIETAIKAKYITEGQAQILREWRLDPFGWGAKAGFPKVMSKVL